MKLVILSNLEASIYGFNAIQKKKNDFFVSSDLKTFVPCPEFSKDFCLNSWNETYPKKLKK